MTTSAVWSSSEIESSSSVVWADFDGDGDLDLAFGSHSQRIRTIPDAYIPGQVRMGPTWNRFGDPNGTLGEDWPRALAHELGHYIFFHPDNYLGLSPEGLLTIVDCPGSVMDDPYANSEFLTAAEWSGDCLNTLAEQYLGRSDWETVHQFWPMLNYTGINSGPNTLPLAVTQIETFSPVTPTTTLAAPFFRLVDQAGDAASIPQGRGQAYLIKTQGNSDPTDDAVIAQGAPVGDLVQARGASPGDRLCVFDASRSPSRLGCLEPVGNVASPVTLYDVAGWEPQIQVTPVSSAAVVVTVTNVSQSSLAVQLLPALGAASDEAAMTQIAPGVFRQIVTAPGGAYYGFVRVWAPGSSPHKEVMVEFMAVEDWGGQALAWGGQALAWGAPVMSSDGQVSVFPMEDLFSNNRTFTLQKLSMPPSLPDWLAPVGQAYRFEVNGTTPDSAILFRYLAGNVPAGQEAGLRIYYSADEGQTWQRLATELDAYHNHASAQVQGAGVYVLISTIEVAPAFSQGWNTFGYPVQETRPITDALAAIDGKYTAVANYDPALPTPWRTYYVTVTAPFAAIANTLTDLEYTRAYWLHATEAITLYLGPDTGLAAGQLAMTDALQTPPATFYGWITPTAEFTPTVGTVVTVWIGGDLCGQTIIQSFNGQLAYVLQVESEDVAGGDARCGGLGDTVTFQVGNWTMAHDHVWDNRQAWFQPLYEPAAVVAPIAGLAAANSGPTPLGSPTTLAATITSGDNVVYAWDFGDGQSGSGSTAQHTYASPGSYTAVVTASNGVGAVTAGTTVVVEETIAGLAAANDGPTALGGATTLNATTTAGSNVTYAWDFGDGYSGSGAAAQHTYASPGSYTAVVTASNGVGSAAAGTTVVVSEEFKVYLPVVVRP